MVHRISHVKVGSESDLFTQLNGTGTSKQCSATVFYSSPPSSTTQAQCVSEGHIKVPIFVVFYRQPPIQRRAGLKPQCSMSVSE